MNFVQAMEFAPPTPACFPDRSTWAAYLLRCQESADPRPIRQSERPFTDAMAFRPVWNFCCDCTPGHARSMGLMRKCKPSMFRGIPITPIRTPKEVACI